MQELWTQTVVKVCQERLLFQKIDVDLFNTLLKLGEQFQKDAPKSLQSHIIIDSFSFRSDATGVSAITTVRQMETWTESMH